MPADPRWRLAALAATAAAANSLAHWLAPLDWTACKRIAELQQLRAPAVVAWHQEGPPLRSLPHYAASLRWAIRALGAPTAAAARAGRRWRGSSSTGGGTGGRQ